MTMHLVSLTAHQRAIYTATRVVLTGIGVTKDAAEAQLMERKPSEVLALHQERVPAHMKGAYAAALDLAKKLGI